MKALSMDKISWGEKSLETFEDACKEASEQIPPHKDIHDPPLGGV